MLSLCPMLEGLRRLQVNFRGSNVILSFLIWSKWKEFLHGIYRGIFPWYQRMVFAFGFGGKNN